jgi:uncharacterized protein YbcC (UPF0753/DUF2309 family)
MKTKNSVYTTELFDKLKHFLPTQAPLKDFIHHNTLHAFQKDTFHRALQQASKIFGYKTYLSLEEYQQLYKTGKIHTDVLIDSIRKNCGSVTVKELLNTKSSERTQKIGEVRSKWKKERKIDLDSMVHPILFRITSSYLDQGIATKLFPHSELGFLNSLRNLEKNGFSSWFKTKKARKLFLDEKIGVFDLLNLIVGSEQAFENYLFDQQFSHPGYSGMVAFVEDNENALLDNRKITLEEYIHLELLLEIDALEIHSKSVWQPLLSPDEKAQSYFSEIEETRIDKQYKIWQEAYEWTFYKKIIHSLNSVNSKKAEHKTTQLIFCIDDRECSLRRHIEDNNPSMETFGTAGFFNVEFYFQPSGSNFTTKSCPAPLNPAHVIQESCEEKQNTKSIQLYHNSNHLFKSWIASTILGFWSAIKMARSIFYPKANQLIVSSSRHMNAESHLSIEFNGEFTKEGKQIGFKSEEMADRVEGLLKSIGLSQDFGELIYVVGHGSSSSNNTHYAGYDCGACSGRPGSVNSRVICSMANRIEVRTILHERGIIIPTNSVFIPVLHDTCKDEFFYFDEASLSDKNLGIHLENKVRFQQALEQNAVERSEKFELILSEKKSKNVHNEVKTRAYSLFEPRPELNHATNALCIVGRRDLTKGVFLDRRSFLNSYDFSQDPEGIYLQGILNAVAPVCGGINLEYYFSRVDNQQLGSGTKLPHNVMGLIGVANGIDGDLRTGLPSQMIEIHDPLRLLVIVEHNPEVVQKVLKNNPNTLEWFQNSWIHLVVVNPVSNEKLEFSSNGWKRINDVQLINT